MIYLAWLYSAWIALSYAIVKIVGGVSTILTFGIGCLTAATLLLPFASGVRLKVTIKSRFSWTRALSFGLTQVCIFLGLKAGDFSGVFAASATAVVLIVPISRFLTGEKIHSKVLIAVSLVTAGILTFAPSFELTVYSALAGFFQSLQVATSRKVGENSSDYIENTLLGLVFGAAIAIGTGILFEPFIIGSEGVAIIAAVILMTQIAFIHLTFRLSPTLFSVISQIRILWSVPIGLLLFDQIPNTRQAIGTLVIFSGAILVSFRGDLSLLPSRASHALGKNSSKG